MWLGFIYLQLQPAERHTCNTVLIQPGLHSGPAPFLCTACAAVRYRTAFDSLREARSALEPAIDSLAAAKEALLAGFEAWLGRQQTQQAASQQVRGAAGGRGGLDVCLLP